MKNQILLMFLVVVSFTFALPKEDLKDQKNNFGSLLINDPSEDCPPDGPACPPIRFDTPKTCTNDNSCRSFQKCCFDTCLQQHICKTRRYGLYWK